MSVHYKLTSKVRLSACAERAIEGPLQLICPHLANERPFVHWDSYFRRLSFSPSLFSLCLALSIKSLDISHLSIYNSFPPPAIQTFRVMPTLTFYHEPSRKCATLVVSPFLGHDEAVREVTTALNLIAGPADRLSFFDEKGYEVTSLPYLSDEEVIEVVQQSDLGALPIPASTPAPTNVSGNRTSLRDTIIAEVEAAEKKGEKLGIQFTLDPPDICNMVEKLKWTKKEDLEEKGFSAANSLNLIDVNWGINTQAWPKTVRGAPYIRPAGAMQDWDLRLLAYVAILSEFTQGQGKSIGEHLDSAVQLRRLDRRYKDSGPTMTDRDVVRVIDDLVRDYKRAIGVSEPP